MTMMKSPSLARLRLFLRLESPGGVWRLLCIVFALLNLKSLPFMWHVRLISGAIKQFLISPSRFSLPPVHLPQTIFQPLITTSHAPLLDCDYNLHKSNSTYFIDLDVSRLHLVSCLCRTGMAKVKTESGGRGMVGIILGGVSCSFRKEIKPFEAYEVWSRVLCWDRKWIYIVSHFVRKGVQPKGYTFQPWKKHKSRKVPENGTVNGTATAPTMKSPPHSAIFASAISKYVFKNGRLTIPPARILQGSNLLPPNLPGHINPPVIISPPSESIPTNRNPTPTPETTSLVPIPTSVLPASTLSAPLSTDTDALLAASTLPHSKSDEWSWEDVERERARGMRIAEMWEGLDALNGEFTGGEEMALGRYWDVMW